MVDITDFFKRPTNEKRSPRPKQTNTAQSMTQEQCPTPQNSPTYILQQQYLPNPTELKSGGFSQIKEKYLLDGQHVSEGSHPG